MAATPGQDEQLARLRALRPKPPPLSGSDELAFVRLKVRTTAIIRDIHAGFCDGQQQPQPQAAAAPSSVGAGAALPGRGKLVPPSVLSFLATLVGNDFTMPKDWLLPSEAKALKGESETASC
eukprot:COSAG01_NODE_2232_length_8117_cov_4.366426_2_plen_122_part_00